MNTTKTADSKGRITLGPQFANKTFIVESVADGEIRIVPAAVIPERETWLYQNQQALASVQRGIQQAQAGQLTTVDPHQDDDWLDQLDG